MADVANKKIAAQTNIKVGQSDTDKNHTNIAVAIKCDHIFSVSLCHANAVEIAHLAVMISRYPKHTK